MIASIKMSGNRLVSIIANDCTPMLTNLYLFLKDLPVSPKHATYPVSNVTGNNKVPLVLTYHPFNLKKVTCIIGPP